MISFLIETTREINSIYKGFFRDDNILVYWETKIDVHPDKFHIYSKNSTIIIRAGDFIYYSCRGGDIKDFVYYLNNKSKLPGFYKGWQKAIRYKIDQEKVEELNKLIIEYKKLKIEKKQKEEDFKFDFKNSNLSNNMTKLSTKISNLKWEIYGRGKKPINIPIDVDTFENIEGLLFKDKNNTYNFEADEGPYCFS